MCTSLRTDAHLRVSGVPWAVAASRTHVLVAASDGASLHGLGDSGENHSLPHPCPVTGAALSRLGDVAATAAVDGIVRVFTTGAKAPSLTLGGDAGATAAHVALSADGRVVAAALCVSRQCGRLDICDWRSNDKVSFATAFAPARVALSDDARFVLVEFHARDAHGALLLCARTGKAISTARAAGRRLSAALDASGERFAIADANALVVIDARAETRVPCNSYAAPRGPAVTLSRDGMRIVAATEGGAFGVWRASDGAHVARIAPGAGAAVTGAALMDGAAGLVSCALDRVIRVSALPEHARFDPVPAAAERFAGKTEVSCADAATGVRVIVARCGAALHVPASDVDEIVDFAIRRAAKPSGALDVQEFERCAIRVVSFLAKCSSRARDVCVAPD